MADVIVEKSEPILEKGAPIVEKSEPLVEPIEEKVAASPIEAPEPKKKGRPAGSKDRAPRKKKLTIVEEPIGPEPPPEVVQPKPKAQPKQQALPLSTLTFEEPAVEEPPSPRTIMREASKTLMQLKHLSDTARKTHLGEMYTKKLHAI